MLKKWHDKNGTGNYQRWFTSLKIPAWAYYNQFKFKVYTLRSVPDVTHYIQNIIWIEYINYLYWNSSNSVAFFLEKASILKQTPLFLQISGCLKIKKRNALCNNAHSHGQTTMMGAFIWATAQMAFPGCLGRWTVFYNKGCCCFINFFSKCICVAFTFSSTKDFLYVTCVPKAFATDCDQSLFQALSIFMHHSSHRMARAETQQVAHHFKWLQKQIKKCDKRLSLEQRTHSVCISLDVSVERSGRV